MTTQLPNYPKLPSVWRAYAQALFTRRPFLAPDNYTLAPITAVIDNLLIPPRQLATYGQVCGFPANGRLPITYPHILATPLHLAILTAPTFPVRLLGLVHVRNVWQSHQPIPATAKVKLRCTLSAMRHLERGQEFDLETEVSVNGRSAWWELSTFLARRHTSSSRPTPSQPPTAVPDTSPEPQITHFYAPANIGRRYAWVSGDLNPIHLTGLTARPFGFPRAIAHGLWTVARTWAALAPHLPSETGTLSVTFKSPVFLPANLHLHSWETAVGLEFALWDASHTKLHLTGFASPNQTPPQETSPHDALHTHL